MSQVILAPAANPDVEAVGRVAVVPTILDIVCRITGMGFAAVARVTKDRWIACGVQDGIGFGLQPGGELKVETTICDEIRQHHEAVVIDHVAEDEIYCGHPTPAMYGFQSYISIPITMPDGSFFGTLCAIDPKPHVVNTPEIVGSFKLFADLIAFHLDANLRLAKAEAAMVREREVSALREQFIAVLGHDLRNPLASVSAAAQMLLRRPERTANLADQIEQSVSRMAGLIEDVLDFARGRLGDGLQLDRDPERPLGPTVTGVVEELRNTHPDRVVELELRLEQPVDCDRARIGQLLSNLVANALTHGLSTEPVRVRAVAAQGWFELSVANGGVPIPADTLGNLFQPFFRGPAPHNRQGLGLGLFIASEVARAHGGTLEVTSTMAETRFTFRMAIEPVPS